MHVRHTCGLHVTDFKNKQNTPLQKQTSSLAIKNLIIFKEIKF